jgi:HEAT repeat protein
MIITRLAEMGTDSDIVRDSFTAIYKIDSQTALPYLMNTGLRYQKDFLVRERVVSLLANYDPIPEIVQQLIAQCEDSSWGVRRAVCMAFAKWTIEETIPSLERLLGDNEMQVQLAAADALSRIHNSIDRGKQLPAGK